MDNDALYRVSRSLTIQIDARGRLIASTSASRAPKEMDADAGFAESVDALLEEGLLVPEDGERQAYRYGFGSLQVQHHMVRDTVRVMAWVELT